MAQSPSIANAFTRIDTLIGWTLSTESEYRVLLSRKILVQTKNKSLMHSKIEV